MKKVGERCMFIKTIQVKEKAYRIRNHPLEMLSSAEDVFLPEEGERWLRGWDNPAPLLTTGWKWEEVEVEEETRVGYGQPLVARCDFKTPFPNSLHLITRYDKRYVDSDDDNAIYRARLEDLDLGGWTGDSEEEFLQAVEDELRYALTEEETPGALAGVRIERVK